MITLLKTWHIFRTFLLPAIVLTGTGICVAAAQSSGNYTELLERGERAGIAEQRMMQIVERAENMNFDTEQISGLLEPAISLAESDLPYEFVLQKSMEGMAKRVPADNIRNVLVEFERGITRSAEIIDPWLEQEGIREAVETEMRGRDLGEAMSHMRNNLIQSSAQALQQNVNEETLNSFLTEVTQITGQRGISVSSVASAMRVMADMPTAADHPGLSNRILVNAVKSGFSARQMQQLPSAMSSAQFFSQLPAEAVGRGVNEQMDRGIPGHQVLENLFRGNIQGGPPGFIPPGLNNIPGRGNDGRRGPPGEPPGGPPDDPPGGPPDDPPAGPPGG